MISPGRIPMSDTEHTELEQLLADAGDSAAGATLTRRDPGEAGPILVTFADGTEHELAEAANG